jgi:hypothetical protein
MQAAYAKIGERSGPLSEAVPSIVFLCLRYTVMFICGALRREKRVTVKACGGVASDTMGPNKIACISLDSFGRFGTFQWVTANPNKKFRFLGRPVAGRP